MSTQDACLDPMKSDAGDLRDDLADVVGHGSDERLFVGDRLPIGPEEVVTALEHQKLKRHAVVVWRNEASVGGVFPQLDSDVRKRAIDFFDDLVANRRASVHG